MLIQKTLFVFSFRSFETQVSHTSSHYLTRKDSVVGKGSKNWKWGGSWNRQAPVWRETGWTKTISLVIQEDKRWQSSNRLTEITDLECTHLLIFQNKELTRTLEMYTCPEKITCQLTINFPFKLSVNKTRYLDKWLNLHLSMHSKKVGSQRFAKWTTKTLQREKWIRTKYLKGA